CTNTIVTSNAAPVTKLTPSVDSNGPLGTPVRSSSHTGERISHHTNAAPASTPAPISGGPHAGSTAVAGSGLYSPATSNPSASASNPPPTQSTRLSREEPRAGPVALSRSARPSPAEPAVAVLAKSTRRSSAGRAPGEPAGSGVARPSPVEPAGSGAAFSGSACPSSGEPAGAVLSRGAGRREGRGCTGTGRGGGMRPWAARAAAAARRTLTHTT